MRPKESAQMPNEDNIFVFSVAISTLTYKNPSCSTTRWPRTTRKQAHPPPPRGQKSNAKSRSSINKFAFNRHV